MVSSFRVKKKILFTEALIKYFTWIKKNDGVKYFDCEENTFSSERKEGKVYEIFHLKYFCRGDGD